MASATTTTSKPIPLFSMKKFIEEGLNSFCDQKL
jgi:hypothetical protein